jgi:hypothetical protein
LLLLNFVFSFKCSIPRNVRVATMEGSSGSAITDDEDVFQFLARSFADKFHGMYGPPCEENGLSGVVHGADLPQGGIAMADTAFGHFHTHMVSTVKPVNTTYSQICPNGHLP